MTTHPTGRRTVRVENTWTFGAMALSGAARTLQRNKLRSIAKMVGTFIGIPTRPLVVWASAQLAPQARTLGLSARRILGHGALSLRWCFFASTADGFTLLLASNFSGAGPATPRCYPRLSATSDGQYG